MQVTSLLKNGTESILALDAAPTSTGAEALETSFLRTRFRFPTG